MEEMKNGRTKEREKTASLHYYSLRKTNKSVVGQAVLLRCIATSLLFLASMGSVGMHSKWATTTPCWSWGGWGASARTSHCRFGGASPFVGTHPHHLTIAIIQASKTWQEYI
jgi:hypothetical protein